MECYKNPLERKAEKDMTTNTGMERKVNVFLTELAPQTATKIKISTSFIIELEEC